MALLLLSLGEDESAADRAVKPWVDSLRAVTK